MIMGQNLKEGSLDRTKENKAVAIGSPSLETDVESLVVGTVGHLIERTMFNYFRERGITKWDKDEILFALEDVILLKHVQALDGLTVEHNLFRYITEGLGWRKPEQVQLVVDEYKRVSTSRRIHDVFG